MNHQRFLNFVIISSSLTIDAIFLFIMACFVIYARSPRVIYAAGIFYGMRGLCQAFFLFEYPKDLLFRDPGFFSLIVPYGTTADFYFSGHSGFLVLATMELIQMKMVVLAFVNLISTLFTAWMLMATRAHYSIGIVYMIFRHTHGMAICLMGLQDSFYLQKRYHYVLEKSTLLHILEIERFPIKKR